MLAQKTKPAETAGWFKLKIKKYAADYRNKAQIISSSRFKYLSFDRDVGMVLRAVFVLNDLSIHLVDQDVDRRVKIILNRFAVNVFATDVHGDLGTVF